MSTRATVVVKIPDSEKGKTYSYKNDAKYKYKTPSITLPSDCNYASIYIHSDGYEKGLGKELVNGYNNFSDIMEEIICGGDSSCIGSPYHACRNEDWKFVQPKFSKDLPERSQEFQYVYSEYGEWFIRSYDSLILKNISKNDRIKEMNLHIKKMEEAINVFKQQLNSIKDIVDKKDSSPIK